MDLNASAAPALESLTDKVYERTKTINEIKHVKLLDFDLDTLGTKVLIKEQFIVRVHTCYSGAESSFLSVNPLRRSSFLTESS